MTEPMAERLGQYIREYEPTKLLVLTNDKQTIDAAIAAAGELPLIILTTNRPSQEALLKSSVIFKPLNRSPLRGLGVLGQAKNLIVATSAEGTIDVDDRLLCFINTDIETVLFTDMRRTGIVSLRDMIGVNTDIQVLESVIAIAIRIAREGSEGHPAGALFVVGDSERVLLNSEESIRNPFSGYNDKNCYVMEEENWNTIKNFAVLDGAIVINNKGYAISAGRYMYLSNIRRISIQEGLGGRHLAGASISAATKAIGVVVSSTGVVRVYKDGREIYKLNAT